LVALVEDIRHGRIAVPDGTALSAIARLTHVDGSLLHPEICAVELINMLRPIAAISRYIVYVALALEQNPDWAARFAGGSDVGLEAFVEEARRFYPFFPVVGAVAKSPFDWAGRQ
jgi:fatty-acid peroxygenase